MSLIVVGTNHKYSPIEIREKIFFSSHRTADALQFLKEKKIFQGTVILATCNRIELYASVNDIDAGIREAIDFISFYHEIDKERFIPYLYIYQEKEATRHLFCVTAGLDSQVLGETQVLAQVKSAYALSQEAKALDKPLDEIFTYAFSIAKRIHSQTQISKGHISIGSLAVDFIKEKLGTLSQKKILLVGVGKVTELVLKYLKKENPEVVFVANRTFARAKALAEKIHARAARINALTELLKEADALITATSCPHLVVKKEMLEKTFGHKLLIIDLAIPRDVDPKIREIKGIELFDLEDLNGIIQKTLEKRKIEAEKAKLIIDKEVEKLWREFGVLAPAGAL